MANTVASNETVTKLLDTNANPAPLGLMGFGLTTILLNIHNAGFYGLSAMILAMGIFYGGAAQIVAGIMEWRKNNTFGTLAFTSYGLFWLTLVALWLLPFVSSGEDVAQAATPGALAMFFLAWGGFTAYMFVGTLKLNRALQVVFGLLTALFVLLAIENFLKVGGHMDAAATVQKIAGWEGILTGLSAVYAAAAQTLNEVFKRVVLPLGTLGRLPRNFVVEHGDEIAELWLKDLRLSPQTPSYGAVSDSELVASSEFALAHVDSYFGGNPADEEMSQFFYNVGATRAAQKLALSELVSAILLLKRNIWTSARTHGLWESAADLQKAVDLNRELGRFFDKAVYYAVAGYTGQAMPKKDAF